MGNTTGKITSAFENGRQAFLPFISSIWFPRYKSLERGMRIDFDWPVTALVGPNGTNKTSILQALAASPARGSIAKFWYTTSVDNIDEWGGKKERVSVPDKDPHRFVYSYEYQLGLPHAECRKARVTRPYRGKSIPPPLIGKNDPDYWEPTKISVSDGMKPIPIGAPASYLHQDRWRLIQKHVVYLDLRAEASAYNKFVDHGRTDRFTDNDRKKRYKVQRTASQLNRVLRSQTSDKRILAKVDSGPRWLSEVAVATVSTILGKEVQAIQVLHHRLYGAEGLTFKLRLGDSEIEYSEAHAGSGEFNIIRLVEAVVEAPKNSLILLDEPEISLHPGAQRKFMEFLLSEVLREKHQVVMTTHSPAIIGSLPPAAIKVLGFNSISKSVNLLASGCSPLEAFNVVGQDLDQPSKLVIHVEDDLAAELVRASLRAQRSTMISVIDVQVIPGGAEGIVTKMIPSFAITYEPLKSTTAVLLDGDKRLPKFHKFAGLSRTEIDRLISSSSFEEVWKTYVSAAPPSLYLHSDSSNKREQELTTAHWASENLGFLGDKQPEEFLLSAALPREYEEFKETAPPDETADWKKWWVARTREERRLGSDEAVTASDIFEIQKRHLDGLPKDHPLFETILQEVNRVFRHHLES